MWRTLKTAFGIEDIRKRILYTLFFVVVVRIGCQIPVPGTDPTVIKEMIDSLNSSGSFNIFNTFTGGSLENFSILALNISPYITASIIMELLSIAIPKLEELHHEGNEGRKKISEYTRYATVVLALIQAVAMSIGFGNRGLFVQKNAFFVIVSIITLTAGSAVLMWIGERITENGIGNGISIVLVVNILAGIPEELGVIWTRFTSNRSIAATILISIIIIAIILAIVCFVVWLHGATRKIPIQYSGRTAGRRSAGGTSSHIPMKVLTASVIPVIFASSLMSLPALIAQFTGHSGNYSSFGGRILMFLTSSYWFSSSVPWYYSLGALVYVVLIFVFSYFYTSITFNPTEIADNLKKQAGFIPGIRPGRPTSDYLKSVLNVIVFIGACGLTIVALLPMIASGLFGIGRISFLGTSLIIIVGVILETLQQIEGRMVSREYDSIF